jgi:phenylacetate-CoA ligase
MHKNVFFFTNFLLNRRNISSTYKSLMKTQWLSKDEILAHQLSKMKEVVDYTSKNVPFYQKRFNSIGLKPGDIKDFSDFKKIPTLSRQDIIDNHREMLDIKFLDSLEKINPEKQVAGRPKSFSLFRKHRLIMNTSSGSTGAPTVFYEDGTQTGLNWANELRIKSWYGVEPGSKEVRFLRSSSEELSKSLIASFRKSFWDQMLLPGVNLIDEDHKRSYERIRDFKPKVLWGFTSAISELAKYMLDNNLEIGDARPEVAITWAAPLYDFEDQRIATAFKCKVTNIYGTREVGHIAARCPSGSFHINQELLYVETNDDDKGIDEDAKEILCTTLVRVPMPFIRFETGDVGELSNDDCKCGRPLKVLKKLDGRTGEIIFDKDGKMIAPNVWCRFFMEGKLASRINRFQIRYMKNKDIEIKIEKGKNYSQETHDLIVNKFYSLFSSENKLTVTYENKIEPMKSGKYKMIVNELTNSN